MISKEQKEQIVVQYGRTAGDTGSPEVQIAILTARINDLTDLFHGTLDLGIGRGNSRRSGKEIVLFHHIKRLAKGGANAGLAVIGREKLVELLYRCL